MTMNPRGAEHLKTGSWPSVVACEPDLDAIPCAVRAKALVGKIVQFRVPEIYQQFWCFIYGGGNSGIDLMAFADPNFAEKMGRTRSLFLEAQSSVRMQLPACPLRRKRVWSYRPEKPSEPCMGHAENGTILLQQVWCVLAPDRAWYAAEYLKYIVGGSAVGFERCKKLQLEAYFDVRRQFLREPAA